MQQAQKVEQNHPGYFDVAFTVMANETLRFICQDPSTPPHLKLFFLIHRFTVGYLRPLTTLKQAFILSVTGMSRSSLYEAKWALQTAGLIFVTKNQNDECVYSLTPQFQPLRGHSDPEFRTPSNQALTEGGCAVPDPPRPPRRTPCKEIKKTYQTDQQQSARSADRIFATSDDEISISLSNAQGQQAVGPDSELESQIASLEAEWKPEQNSVEPEVVKSSAAGRPTEITSEQGKLARQLHQTGIHWRIAVRLVRENDQQLIQNALARLKDRPNVKHPAGWLVEEIRAGGYNPPAPSPDTLIKQAHQTLADKRQQERQLAEIERDQANQKQLQLWAHFEKLPLDQRQSLIDQARRRLARLSPKMAQAPLDSVPLRAMILELAQASTMQTSLPMLE
jgi:hypothetical protein